MNLSKSSSLSFAITLSRCAVTLSASPCTVVKSNLLAQPHHQPFPRRYHPTPHKRSRIRLASALPYSLVVPPQRRAMAWTCSALTNDGLVDNLVREDIIKKGSRIEGVFRLVDRRTFLPPGAPSSYAYEDSPQTIPCEATISAPHMHAMALELLEPYLQPGNRALDVGAGSGYLVACMALLVGSNGTVSAIEHASELTQFANKNLSAFYKQISTSRNGAGVDVTQVTVVTKDGRLGDEENAPFDAIHVGAAAPEVPPALVQQLKKGGAMVIPIGPPHGSQRLDVITKDDNDVVSQKTVCRVRYVPLCDLNQQLGS